MPPPLVEPVGPCGSSVRAELVDCESSLAIEYSTYALTPTTARTCTSKTDMLVCSEASGMPLAG